MGQPLNPNLPSHFGIEVNTKLIYFDLSGLLNFREYIDGKIALIWDSLNKF